MRIIIFGPPGVGKGTQAKLLCKKFGLKQIATGDLFRAAIKAGTEIGKKAVSYMHSGKLVPDVLVWEICREGLEAVNANNFILDGYPRTVQQALWLDQYLEEKGGPVPHVISLEVPQEVIVERLSKRRINRKTGEIYHLDFNPPPDDVPREWIIQRKDDRPEAIRRRMEVFHRQTMPVKVHYQNLQELHKIDGVGEIDEVFNRIKSVLVQNPQNVSS